jgi:hypothetical protein
MTTTHTFLIEHPENLQHQIKNLDIEPNRDVLRILLPQLADEDLDHWICPFVILNPSRRR